MDLIKKEHSIELSNKVTLTNADFKELTLTAKQMSCKEEQITFLTEHLQKQYNIEVKKRHLVLRH